MTEKNLANVIAPGPRKGFQPNISYSQVKDLLSFEGHVVVSKLNVTETLSKNTLNDFDLLSLVLLLFAK